MEAIGILIIVGIVGGFVALPFIALARAARIRDELNEVQGQLALLQHQLNQLKATADARTSQSSELPISPNVENKVPSPPLTESIRQAIATPEGVTTTPVAEVLSPPAAVPESHSSPPPLPPSRPVQATPPRPTATPPPSRPLLPKPAVNWEQFVGTKLIAWLGGLILFLAAAYFVKYSFDHDLIPPEVRVTFGFLLGIGLLVGGFQLKKKAYEVLSQTLCATGVVILYAVNFACHSLYHFAFFTPILTFVLMALVTTCAFLLAVRMNALVVAVLGLLGGFMTPVLLSTGQDNPLGLFGYIALLDCGLIAGCLVRPWPFLIPLAAACTGLMELGWTDRFLEPEKLGVAVVTQWVFCGLFLAGFEWALRRGQTSVLWIRTAAGLAVFAILYASGLLFRSSIGAHFGPLGLIVLGGNLSLITLAWRTPRWPSFTLMAASLSHLFLAAWMVLHLTPERLFWGLGAVLIVAILHTLTPVVLSRRNPPQGGMLWIHLIPPASLGLMMIPVFKLEWVSAFVWPLIFLIDLLAMALAVATRSLVSVLAVIVLTGLAAVGWVFRMPSIGTDALPTVLAVIGSMSLVFLFAGMITLRKLKSFLGEDRGAWSKAFGGLAFDADTRPETFLALMPALSALMPFLLLILVTLQLSLPNPSPVFALAMALTILLLSVCRSFRQPVLPLVSLISVVFLQSAWLLHGYSLETSPWLVLGWVLAFSGLIFSFPFLCGRLFASSSLPWAASALAFPLHFHLLYRVIDRAWPNWGLMGLLPAVLTIPPLVSCVHLARRYEASHPNRNAMLAWYGGVALFFITLVFPIQFERQWITVSWALEGVALCWLFHRIPHPGLRGTGVVLMGVAFVRLALNPAVLSYHARGEMPLLNWYLYAYGTVILSLFAGARLLAPPRDLWRGRSMPSLLNAQATVLLFLLLNIEIADYFSSPGERSLTFSFEGNLARDMAYTIAWGLFSLALVAIGLRRKLKTARFAGLGLLGATALKLVVHDVSQLAQLYRVGALAGVAVVLLLQTFLYQKFVAKENGAAPKPPKTE